MLRFCCGRLRRGQALCSVFRWSDASILLALFRQLAEGFTGRLRRGQALCSVFRWSDASILLALFRQLAEGFAGVRFCVRCSGGVMLRFCWPSFAS
jgi:hypothetical protein